jgi:hypothetical protein
MPLRAAKTLLPLSANSLTGLSSYLPPLGSAWRIFGGRRLFRQADDDPVPVGGVNIRARPTVAGDALASVSSASYNGELASESIAAAFGENLASGVAAATSLPLPTTLGGVKVKFKDSAGL